MPPSYRLPLVTLILCGVLGAPSVARAPQEAGLQVPESAPSKAAPAAPDDPRALLLQGRALQPRCGGDDPAGAVALLRKVAQLLPQSAEAQLRLSEALVDNGDGDGALDAARKAVELDPQGSEGWAHLGLLLWKRSTTTSSAIPEARTALQKATRLLPGDAELWFRLAEVGEFQKDSDLALAGWLRFARLRPQFPTLNQIWERVILHAKNVNRYEARREAVLALAQLRSPAGGPDPKYLRGLEELAKEQVQSGYLAHAEESFRLLGRLLPEHMATVLENISHIQVQAGRFEEALGSLEKAIALDATPRNRFNLAVCHMYLGHFAEAEPILRSLLPELKDGPDVQPSASGGRTLLATAMALQRKPQAMLQVVQGWPEAAEQAEISALKFQALVDLENWKGARRELRDGIVHFPKHPLFAAAKEVPPKELDERLFNRKEARGLLRQLALEHRSAVLAEFRRWEASLDACHEGRRAHADRAANLLLLESNALDQLGRFQEAIQALREAQKLDPDNPGLQNNLGYLLLERGGSLEEAARLIEAAVRQEPQSSSVQDSWGWVLFRQGKFEEAEKALRRAAELDPFSHEIRRHLGEVLLKLGREDEALEQWERALAFDFPDRKVLEKRYGQLQVDRAKRDQVRQESAPVAPETEPGPDGDDE